MKLLKLNILIFSLFGDSIQFELIFSCGIIVVAFSHSTSALRHYVYCRPQLNFFLLLYKHLYNFLLAKCILDFYKILINLPARRTLERVWHPAETNLRCAGCPRNCMLNPNSLALIVSEISAFIRTDGQTDMARSTRLVILIKNIYTLWVGNASFCLLCYFPTNLVYPCTQRVKSIKIQ